MILLFFNLIFSIPENCYPGIKYYNYYAWGGILSIGSISGNIRDIHLEGAFCPRKSGQYRLIYNGNIDSVNENTWSIYSFNRISSKNRISNFYFLNKSSCYPYIISHSTNVGSAYGILKYQYLNEIEEIMNSSVSYSCDSYFCLNNRIFPICEQLFSFSRKISHINLLNIFFFYLFELILNHF